MRGFPAAWLLGLTALLSPIVTLAASSGSAAAARGSFEVQLLRAAAPTPSPNTVASGSLDSYFESFNLGRVRQTQSAFSRSRPPQPAPRSGASTMRFSFFLRRSPQAKPSTRASRRAAPAPKNCDSPRERWPTC